MSEFLAPAYGTRSLADVLPAVGVALGAWESTTRLVLPPAEAYVVLLVDGLGYEQLRRHPDEAPYLTSLLATAQPGTAGVPSTTATSLTSLGTGLTPGLHGVVGFTSRIPGTDKLLNALMWSRDVDPLVWQPHPTAFGALAQAGVATATVVKREFADSGLTRASTRGAEFVGADRLGERLVAVQQASARRPSLTYVYDGDLDWTGHRYGVGSPQWREQLAMIDLAAHRLREALDGSVRLLVLADHGMVDVAEEDRVDVDAVDGLRDGLSLLGGEARFRHLYCRAGAVDDVVHTWREGLGARAQVLTREDAIAAGWFGPGTDPVRGEVRPRIGDVVVACQGTWAVLSKVDFPYESRLVGMHGSLTVEEMLVPILLD